MASAGYGLAGAALDGTGGEAMGWEGKDHRSRQSTTSMAHIDATCRKVMPPAL